jgi:hypothetical protein
MSEILSKSPTIIEKVGTGYVLFYNTNSKLDFSTKDVANLSLTPDLQYILIDDGGGTIYKIDVVNLTSVVDRSIPAPFTPLDPMANPIATGDYSDQIRAVYDYLLKNIYKACCVSSAPTYVGSLISAYPDLGTLQASAPGTTGILYTTTDTNLLYWWDSVASDFKLVSGVQYFANFAAFPVTGEERVLYYDIAEGEMYVWESAAYKSLCCEASHLQQKYSQTGHGFSVGDWVYSDGDGTFALTLADDISTSYAVGVVQQVIDANTFVLNHGGFLSVGVPAETGGTVMYLDETTPGALRNTAPAAPNIVRPVMVVLDNATTGLVLLSLQNEGSGGGGGGVASVTGESVDNTDPANPVVNAWPLAGTGADLANGTIEVDPAFTGDLISIDDGLGNKAAIAFSTGGISVYWTDGSSVTQVSAGGSPAASGVFTTKGSDSGSFTTEENSFSDAATYPVINVINGRRCNFGGLAAPTINDDSTLGYADKSFLIYDGRFFICTDPTPGAAVWNEVGAGGGLSLETDGTPNGDQALLNLVAGDNVTLTDDGNGNVTIDSSSPEIITFLPSDTDTSGSGTSNVNVTGAAVTLAANARYLVKFTFKTGCSGTGGFGAGLTYPSGATGTWAVIGNTTAFNVQSAFNTAILASAATTGTAYNAEANTNRILCAEIDITTSATAGTLQFIIAGKNGAQTSTIFQDGSRVSYRRIS